MPHQRDWIDYLVAFAPLIAIAVAIGVALMQYYLQRQQLKQNLYDKRWEIRKEIRNIWIGIMDENPVFRGDIEDITAHTRDLFGADIQDYLDRLAKRSITILIKNDQRNKLLAKGETATDVDEELHTLCLGMLSLYTEGNTAFRPYLQLHQDQSWFGRAARSVSDFVDREIPEKLKERYPAQ